jgi:DNA-binding transcriptional LysR family regulator
MNISLRQLKAFLQVARLGNFTRAAEQMHITQAGLSIMMRELEAQLDCRLFDRTTRIVSLTAAGEQFLPVAARTLADLESSAAQLGAITERARQTLLVGATPLISSNVLPAVCQAFRIANPEVNVKLVDTDRGQLQTLVEQGELDFGLGAFFKPTAGIELTPLFPFQLMWISPGADTKGSGQPTGSMPWEALVEVQLIGLPAENRIQQFIENHLAAIGRAHEERLTFNNFETLIAMVAAGVGTAIVPSYAMAACRRHRVRTALLDEPATPLNFYRVTKRGRCAANAMAAFTEAFIAAATNLDLPAAETQESLPSAS